MESYLFADVEAAADTMVVEGYHKPGSLTRSSGCVDSRGRHGDV